MILYLSLLLVMVQAPQGAEIRGRVTDAETGAPVGQVVISLSRWNANEQSRQTRTDEDGVYRFTGLAPGTYSALLMPTYRGTYAVQLLEPSSGPREIIVKDGDVREVNVALQPTRAIPVRVVDEWGDPLSGIEATARLAAPGGRPRLTYRHMTDDQGRMRIFGLERGRYVVCAEIDPARSATGRPASARRDAYLPTCYPSSSPEDAETVLIDRADAGEIEIRMRRGKTFTVAGQIFDASGVPAATAFASLETFKPGSSSGRGIIVDANGRFRMENVLPGEYGIQASVGGPMRPEQRYPLEQNFLPVSVTSDVTDIVIHLQRGIDVPGTVELDDPSVPFPDPPGSGLMIATRLVDDRLPGQGSYRSATARKDRTFTLEGMFGTRELDVLNVPRGWYVKSIEYDGKDVVDAAVAFKAAKNPLPLKVLLSTRGATLSGRAVDDSGSPAGRAQIIAFREEGASRHHSARSAAAGTWRLGPLRRGTYVLVAIPGEAESIQLGQWERIARLKAVGTRVALGEMEERTVEVRLVPEK